MMLMYLGMLDIPFGFFYLLMIVEVMPNIFYSGRTEDVVFLLSCIGLFLGLIVSFYLSSKKYHVFVWVNISLILLSTVYMLPDGWTVINNEIKMKITELLSLIGK